VRGVLLVVLCGCGRIGFGAHDNPGTNPDGNSDSPGPGEDAMIDALPPNTALVVAFTQLPNGSAPTARRATGAAAAPDNRIWIYGGFAGAAGPQADIYAYTPGTGWTAPTATNIPPARERHALAYDPMNDRLVVFGGYSGTFPNFITHDELYVFTPATNAWTQLPKVGTWPTPRKDAVMTWAPSLGKLLLYGGNDGSGSANRSTQIWTLSIDAAATTATWTLLTPTGTAPANSAPCAAYDPSAKQWILYGGEPTDGNDANTTTRYLVDTNQWQADTTTGTSPGGRSFASCAWDPSVGRVVLYGGQSSGNPVAGAFSYEPTTKAWASVPLDSGSASPGNLSDAGATYSAMLGGVFIFGGRTATTSYTNQSLLVDLKPM